MHTRLMHNFDQVIGSRHLKAMSGGVSSTRDVSFVRVLPEALSDSMILNITGQNVVTIVGGNVAHPYFDFSTKIAASFLVVDGSDGRGNANATSPPHPGGDDSDSDDSSDSNPGGCTCGQHNCPNAHAPSMSTAAATTLKVKRVRKHKKGRGRKAQGSSNPNRTQSKSKDESFFLLDAQS